VKDYNQPQIQWYSGYNNVQQHGERWVLHKPFRHIVPAMGGLAKGSLRGVDPLLAIPCYLRKVRGRRDMQAMVVIGCPTITRPDVLILLDMFPSVAARTAHLRKTINTIILNPTQPLILRNGRRERQWEEVVLSTPIYHRTEHLKPTISPRLQHTQRRGRGKRYVWCDLS
jgi:hypothetical protein